MSEMELAVARVSLARLLDAIEQVQWGLVDVEELYEFAGEIEAAMEKHAGFAREIEEV